MRLEAGAGDLKLQAFQTSDSRFQIAISENANLIYPIKLTPEPRPFAIRRTKGKSND